MSASEPWLGSHLSIAGGIHKAIEAAEELHCDCVQVFTKNQRQWKTPPLTQEQVDLFSKAMASIGWTSERVVSHNSYLVNMASPDPEAWEKSVRLMREELERCERLGISACVAHPGAHLESPRKPGEKNDLDRGPNAHEINGLKRIVKALDRLEKETRGYAVVTALENTVGSGTNLGYDFTHLGWIREHVKIPERIGFCFDTCHALAAGYDMTSSSLARSTLERLDEACGFGDIRVVHLNDSIGALGSRKDRHEHIGEGNCTLDCFREVLATQELWQVPMVLETEKGLHSDGRPWDEVNLDRLASLVQGGRSSRKRGQPA